MLKEICLLGMEGFVEYFSCYERENYIELSMISIKKEHRNRGYASEIMKRLCQYADQKSLPILCSPEVPEENKGLSYSALIKFYENFGFQPNKGKIRDYSLPSHSYKRINS